MSHKNRFRFLFIGSVFSALTLSVSSASATPADGSPRPSLWEHDNLIAWCVVPFDAKKRSPEERAAMLQGLGFKHFAYDWRENDVPTFDAEIEALQHHGIELTAWWFPIAADDALAKSTLETFKRHGVHPQLWVVSTRKEPEIPGMPKTEEEFNKLTPEQFSALLTKAWQADMPKTPQEQLARVQEETDRIQALVRLAAPYGTKVELYNHNGWFGMVDNQLAIIHELKKRGVRDVGMVYNFSHARDAMHDDTVRFPQIWKEIRPYVVAVNITGTHMDDSTPIIYPSQGDRELEMMRTIQGSDWKGRVGVIAEKGGDAEITLKNYMIGLDWLALELKQAGSAGPRPFPPVL